MIPRGAGRAGSLGVVEAHQGEELPFQGGQAIVGDALTAGLRERGGGIGRGDGVNGIRLRGRGPGLSDVGLLCLGRDIPQGINRKRVGVGGWAAGLGGSGYASHRLGTLRLGADTREPREASVEESAHALAAAATCGSRSSGIASAASILCTSCSRWA